MTLDERIATVENEHTQAVQQIAQWNEARLKCEGALLVLKQMRDDQKTPPPET